MQIAAHSQSVIVQISTGVAGMGLANNVYVCNF